MQATAHFSDQSTQDVTTQAAWSSGTPSVARVNNEGKLDGLTIGQAQITATFESVSGTTEVVVTPAVITSLQVNPVEKSLAKGTGQTYQAVAFLSDGSHSDVTNQVQWTLSDTDVAAIDGQGQLTALQSGATTINATLGTLMAQAELTVTPAQPVSLQVSPKGASLADGTSRAMEAVATFTDGTTQDVTAQVNWVSLNTGVATVNLTGLLTAQNPGEVTVRATFGAIFDEAVITVTEATIVRVALSPAAVTVPAGAGASFLATAILTDNSQQDVTNQASWSSSAPSVATVGGQGRVSSFTPGNATITAQFGLQQGQAQVTVSTAVLIGIQVLPDSPLVAEGLSQSFSATGFYSDNTSQVITDQVTWTSSDPAVATIDTTGLGLARTTGSTTVRANLGEVSGSTELQVTDAVLLSLEIEPADSSLPKGLGADYKAFGNFSNGQRTDLSSQVAWNSSQQAVATVSLSGHVTAVNSGETVISAQLGETMATTSLTVTDAVIVQIEITPSELILAVTGTKSLRAVATYSDNSTQNVTQEVTWNSDNTNVATIVPGGQLTSVSEGTALVSATLGGIQGGLELIVRSEQEWPLDDVWNKQTEGDQECPAIDLNSPKYVVVWQGPDGAGYGVYARGSSTNDTEVKINVDPSTVPTTPDVAVAPDGKFLVSWASESGIRYRVFDGEGQPLHTPVLLPSVAPKVGKLPRVATLSGPENEQDRYALVWQEDDGPTSAVRGEIINLLGSLNPLGSFNVGSLPDGRQAQPKIDGTGTLEFVVAWADDRGGTSDIYARRFVSGDSSTEFLGGEIAVNSLTEGDQYEPSLDANPEGEFVVGWTSESGAVYGRRFAPDGMAYEIEQLVHSADGASSSVALYSYEPALSGHSGKPTASVVFQAPDGDGEGIFSIGLPSQTGGGRFGDLLPMIPLPPPLRINQTTIQGQIKPEVVTDFKVTDTPTYTAGGGNTIWVFEGHDGPNSRGIIVEFGFYAYIAAKFVP